MLQLNFSSKANGIPVLSKNKIEKCALEILKDFQPYALNRPCATDTDALLQSYLGMNCIEKYLSFNALYLGLTTFNDETVIIFDPQRYSAEVIKVEANTVIIDSSLCNNAEQLPRKRFTQAHEAGHIVFHRKYYEGLAMDKYPKCLRSAVDEFQGRHSSFSDYDWLEWQANRFASAILMPSPMLAEVCERYKDIDDEDKKYSLMIVATSSIFEVSETAALIRLKDHGMVPRNYTPDMNEIKYIRQFRSGLRMNRNGGK